MATRIYTRTGDEGSTVLFGGKRFRKDAPLIEAFGTVDELNAALGMARALGPDAETDARLAVIQNDLFRLGADLSTPFEEDRTRGRLVIERLEPERTAQLEAWIDAMEDELPPLANFILPGGHPAAAALHTARTICRRAERRCAALASSEAGGGLAINPAILPYINRLSDLLFVLARVVNYRNGVPDVIWSPSAS
jgi:cob(I)alamin adenosyltransferase